MVNKSIRVRSKCLPGNKYLRITLSGIVLDIHGNNVTSHYVTGKTITYDFFNKSQTFNLKFIIILAWFEIGKLNDLNQEIDNILLYPVENAILNRITRYIMFFNKPVYYDNEYRIIPGLIRYAINKNGDVLDTERNMLLHISDRFKGGYRTVFIYNPDSSRYMHYPHHRLYALAWLENDIKEIRHFINHKDGNKKNNSLDNLEWCTHEENVEHALSTGLNKTRIGLKIRDRWTGEIKHLKSSNEARLFLNITSNSIKRYLIDMQPWHLINGKYEIKTEEDKTPWFYEQEINKYFDSGKAFIVYTVINTKTGKTYKFNRLNSIYKVFNLKPIKSSENNAASKVNILNSKYPEYLFSYEILAIKGPYVLININTNERFIVNSIIELEKLTGIDRNKIRQDFIRKDRYIYNKTWVCYPVSEEHSIDLKTFKELMKLPRYEVTNLETNETKIYKSLREIEMLLKIDVGTSSTAIEKNNGRTYKRLGDGKVTNYHIRPLYD